MQKHLLKLLRNEDPYVRRAAIDALATVASQAEVQEALLELIRDEYRSLRNAAANTLAEVAYQAPVRDRLLELIGDEDEVVRSTAAGLLQNYEGTVTRNMLRQISRAAGKCLEAIATLRLWVDAFEKEEREAHK